MKVLMVEPGKIPYEADIEPGLRSLQAAVDGSIQAVYPYEDPVALICNEDGKFMGLPLNRALRDDTGEIYDIIAGNFIITGLGEESFSDLSPDLMEKYKEREQVKGRKKLILTCLPDKVEMYKKFGFKDHGIGDSVWGGEAWHEMDIVLE